MIRLRNQRFHLTYFEYTAVNRNLTKGFSTMLKYSHDLENCIFTRFDIYAFFLNSVITHLAGTVDDTGCFSVAGIRPQPNECPGFDIKQYDGEVPVMLKLLGMRSTPSLPSLPGSLHPGEDAPDSVLSISNRNKLRTNAKRYCL